MTRYGAYLAAGFASIAIVIGGLITINGSVGELMLIIRMLSAGIGFLALAVLSLAMVTVRDGS
jgi:hypothetical protein